MTAGQGFQMIWALSKNKRISNKRKYNSVNKGYYKNAWCCEEVVVIGQGCYQARLSTSLVWRFFSKLTAPGATALWFVSPCPDGGWLLPQVLSHPSCSCPSCLSLGEALSGRWVDLSFSLCGRSACVSLYFLGIVERSQAGHLGTGASGRQTPQAPGTSTTFSPFFQGSCRCANIAPPMVKPVKRRSLVQ